MSLCMGCMQELNGSVICPNCHFDNSEVQSAPFLPFGTELAGRYVQVPDLKLTVNQHAILLLTSRRAML